MTAQDDVTTAAPSPEKHDPLTLSHCLEDTAKWWWGASLVTKLVGFVAGLIGIVCHWNGSPYLLAAVAVIAEVFQFRSDAIRAPAQWLKRKVEDYDFMGWALPERRLADVVAACPGTARRRCLRSQNEKHSTPYFASHEPPGARRALENLMESAWYSKHLCVSMIWWCSAAVALTLIVAIVTLLLTLNTSVTPSTHTAIAQGVTAALVLLFSLGLIRFVIGFHRFAKAAASTDDSCAALLTSDARVDQEEVLRLLHEYQLARNSAPAIPTWLWTLRERDLNTLWAQHRAKLPVPQIVEPG